MLKSGNGRSKLRSRTGLLGVATLAACAASSGIEAQSAAVSRPEAKPAAQGTAARQPAERSFHIAAGPLGQALEQFRAQSGVAVRVDLPAAQLPTLVSAGIDGVFANEAALRALLVGTGLGFRFAGPDLVAVGLRETQTVDVSSGLPDSLAITKFTEPLLDTPQTIVAIPPFVLKDEGNRTLLDAVRNVPGISIAAGESGAQGDSLTIRGFTARNDIFLDGIRDFGSYYRDSFDYEQVEVLEGPAGVQFGRGSTGGVINQESKVPAANTFVNIGTQFGTDATRRITGDLNLPVSPFAAGTAFRVNAMGTEGGVAGRPFAQNRRFGVAPSITFGMNAKTRLTLSYFHFNENDTPDYGLPWFENGLAQGVDRHSYFGFPSGNFLNTHDDIVTLKANHAFSGSLDVHTIARWANYPRNVQITEPQICSNVNVSTPVGGYVAALPTSAVNTGLPCAYTPQTLASAITVNRNQLAIKSVEGDLWDQTEVTARFKTFGIRNDFAGGAEGGREVSNPIRTSFVENKVNSVASTNLLTPAVPAAFAGVGYTSSITHVKSESAGLYFVDTLHLGKYVEASGGVRWDYFDTLFNLYAPQTTVAGASLTASIAPISQTVHQPSYRAALVVKPTPHGSVYFDYGTSFNPSAESLSLSVSSSLLPPEENGTYEFGAKYSLVHDRLMIEGAYFRTEKDNARETDPTNSNNIVLAGNQLVKGFQASAVGRLAGGTDLIVGYAYLNSDVLYSQLFPTSIGHRLANVPQGTFNFFVTHNLPWRLGAGFGGNFVGDRQASSTVPYVPTSYSLAQSFAPGAAPCAPTARVATNCYQVLSVATKQVPAYWTFNAMLKRPVTEKIDLQANVYNLTNAFYIDQPHPSHLIPGAGLSALIGANFRF